MGGGPTTFLSQLFPYAFLHLFEHFSTKKYLDIFSKIIHVKKYFIYIT